MNFKLKALVAAAVATISISGTANAIPLNNMFLAVFDTTTNNSFVADLGIAASSFGDANQSYNFSGANWNTFLANSTTANTTYQILGYNGTNNLWTTSTSSTISGITSEFNTASRDSFIPLGNFNNFLTLANSGTTNYVPSTAQFGKVSEISNNWAAGFTGFTTTAQLGQDNNFFQVTRVSTQNGRALAVTPLSTWNLSSAGVLSYTTATAPIPEADTWAMMLLGLGFMGFVARRRA